ncbi:DUF481 domain-containing protein, partial [Akkermansiaceae bacterium]|nr:DUF481 domain-containing protein [Akkermansiaceae bacterium]
MKTTYLLLRLSIFLLLPLPASETYSAGDFLSALTVTDTKKDPLWEITGAASIGLAQGNTNSNNYGLQALATYKKDQNEGHLGADFFYSENNGTATTNSLRIFSQYNHLIGNQWFIGTFSSFLNNEIADLDYRFDTGVTLGYYFFKNDKTKLSLETGPGYTWENQDKLRSDYFSLRLAQNFEHKFNKELKIWQSTILTPKASDLGDTLFIAEAGIQILLTEDWSLRTALRYQYDSTPAGSQDKSDILLLTGLSYSSGGFKKSTKPDRMTLKPKDKKPREIKKGWTTTAALSHSLAKGNSDSLFLGTSVDSAYRKKNDETFLSLTYNFSENGGDNSADSLRTNIQHNRVFNETHFLGGSLGYFRDDIADVSYRFTPSATAGYYFLKQNDITLSVEAGPSMIFEKIGGLTEDFFTVTAAQNFTWQISENLNFSQHITGVFDPSDRQNYIFSARAKLDTNIT